MRRDNSAPTAVRAALVLWLLAIGAAIVVALRMYAGRGWARWVLTVALGVVGTLSLIVDPISWLAHGNSLTRLVAHAGIVDLLFGGSRLIHVAAVLASCVLMFVPSANAYFRTPARRPAREGVAR